MMWTKYIRQRGAFYEYTQGSAYIKNSHFTCGMCHSKNNRKNGDHQSGTKVTVTLLKWLSAQTKKCRHYYFVQKQSVTKNNRF